MLKKIKILLCLLIFFESASAIQQPPLPLDECVQHTPMGTPTANSAHIVQICRKAYLSTFDIVKKIPRVVSYVLTPEHALGCLSRTNAFAPDKSLIDSPKPKDYAKSGYDMGHMMNDADSRWDLQAEEDSFILSNIAPQLPQLNRKEWKRLEDKTRIWAVERRHSILIYVGTIGEDKTMKGGISVPTAFFKIIVDLSTNETLAFLFGADGIGKMEDKLTSVAEIQHQSGLLLPVPNYSKSEMWPQYSKSNTKIKSKICGLK